MGRKWRDGGGGQMGLDTAAGSGCTGYCESGSASRGCTERVNTGKKIGGKEKPFRKSISHPPSWKWTHPPS